MALRPGKQRLSATPIIAKGVLYPLQNPRASKLATHGFASKSDTRHRKKHAQACFFQLNPPMAEEIHLRWMKLLRDEICLSAGDGGGFNFI